MLLGYYETLYWRHCYFSTILNQQVTPDLWTGSKTCEVINRVIKILVLCVKPEITCATFALKPWIFGNWDKLEDYQTGQNKVTWGKQRSNLQSERSDNCEHWAFHMNCRHNLNSGDTSFSPQERITDKFQTHPLSFTYSNFSFLLLSRSK